jgi:preprotein translocase subunit YajC
MGLLIKFLTTAPPPQRQGIISFLFLILIFVAFLVFIYLPQYQQKKKHEKLIKSLKKGDKVVTSGGIHGIIVKIGDSTVVLQIGKKSEITVEKGNIVQIIS